jgi:hypothetical protein
MAHKQALIEQTSVEDHKDTSVTDQSSDAAVQQLQAPEPWRQRFLRVLAGNLHYVTFLPLVLISALQSINILAAAITCTGLVCFFILVSYCCFKAGHVKVRLGGSSHLLLAYWAAACMPCHLCSSVQQAGNSLVI